MCDLDVTGVSSIFSVTHSGGVSARMLPTFDLNCEENDTRLKGFWVPSINNSNLVVYYESIKRELKTEPINECRCDERLKSRVEKYCFASTEVRTRDLTNLVVKKLAVNRPTAA